jgi:radical SAM protein with 4Fe4S-binding SPASM domain
VYPCPALPLALGSLTETTLKELAGGDAKKRFRAVVTTLPGGCRKCAGEKGCHGGCRGRSLVIGGDIAQPDPVCELAIQEKG